MISLFALNSCLGSPPDCETCTKEGEPDVKICDEGGIGIADIYTASIADQEDLGYTCDL